MCALVCDLSPKAECVPDFTCENERGPFVREVENRDEKWLGDKIYGSNFAGFSPSADSWGSQGTGKCMYIKAWRNQGYKCDIDKSHIRSIKWDYKRMQRRKVQQTMRDYKVNTFQMNNSIFQFGLTPIQFVVYSYLKYCAGNRCACSIKLQTIASVCECSRSSVKRALNVLRVRGFIDIKGGAQKLRGKGHRQTCNRYYCLDSSEWKAPIERWPMRSKSCSPHNQ